MMLWLIQKIPFPKRPITLFILSPVALVGAISCLFLKILLETSSWSKVAILGNQIKTKDR
jgi:hypothetical protein